MNISEQLSMKLAEWQPPPGRQMLTVADQSSGWAACLTVDAKETLGCFVWEVFVKRTPALERADLGNRARSLAGRLSGLRESLHVVEVDELRNEALLRSAIPEKKDAGLYYHEVLMRGNGEAFVRRFHANVDKAGRAQIGFAVTNATLEKLVGDLASG